MDQEKSTWAGQEPARYQQKVSPFADSPYEMPHAPQYRQEPAPQAPKKERKGGKAAICVLLALALVAVGCGISAVCTNAYWNDKMETYSKVMDNKLAVLQQELDKAETGSDTSAPVTGEGMTPRQVYEANVQAVVAISNQSLTTNIYGQVSETASSGTGFAVSADGYIVTNYHVVQGATTLRVITWDSQEHKAELVGYDATNDLAVLKIDATDFPCVKLGSSDKMKVGDQVAAIGNPLGELTSTLTVGYVSAKDRMVSTEGSYLNMIQTDAAINSGNSGGPLFNMAGEVVGITTAKYSGTSNSGATIEGIGFAIPMDDVVGMVEDLMSHGFITGAYLGVMVQDMSAEAAQMYGLPMGAYVLEVTEGSCAEKAGIRAKDIIVNIGGHDVENLAELTRALRRFEAGQTTTVSLYRGGQQIHLEITLDQKPQTGTNTQPQETTPDRMPTEPNMEETAPEGIDPNDIFGNLFPPFFGFGG